MGCFLCMRCMRHIEKGGECVPDPDEGGGEMIHEHCLTEEELEEIEIDEHIAALMSIPDEEWELKVAKLIKDGVLIA